MRTRLFLLNIAMVFSLISDGQSLDTITKNIKKPPVLDLLSGRQVLQNSTPLSSPVKTKSPAVERNVRQKTITEKSPRDKAVLIRAIEAFVPADQFNVSVYKELTYNISEYSTQNIELPGVLNEEERIGNGSIELIKEKTIVRLEVDTTMIQGDVDFFERLVFNTLDLDLFEDEVSVKIWDFPYAQVKRKNRVLKPGNENDNLIQGTGVIQEPFYTKIWVWAIILGSILLIVVLIYILRRKPEIEDEGELVIDNNTFKKMSLSALDKAPISLKKNEFKKLLIESPEAVASFMENIIESGQEEALIVFSTLAKPFPDLVGQLKPHMTYSAYLTLLNRVDEDIEEKIDPDTQDKFLLTFNNTVRAIANEKNSVEKSPDHKVFGFVDQLSDIQIFKLMEGDRPEMSSVLFAQLKDTRKLKVLELLDPVEKSEMLLKLTDMSRLPLSVIREIGQRYARKAKELAGLYNIDIDGIGAIISTLDELEENKQKEILETMLQNDLDKGQIVEQKFIGFFNLRLQSQEILENALSDIDTEVLLNSLFGTDQETIEAILAVRPPREREMIKSELESGKTVSSEAKTKARKVILTNVRRFV